MHFYIYWREHWNITQLCLLNILKRKCLRQNACYSSKGVVEVFIGEKQRVIGELGLCACVFRSRRLGCVTAAHPGGDVPHTRLLIGRSGVSHRCVITALRESMSFILLLLLLIRVRGNTEELIPSGVLLKLLTHRNWRSFTGSALEDGWRLVLRVISRVFQCVCVCGAVNSRTGCWEICATARDRIIWSWTDPPVGLQHTQEVRPSMSFIHPKECVRLESATSPQIRV